MCRLKHTMHTEPCLISLYSTLGFVYSTWDELIISISQVGKPLENSSYLLGKSTVKVS